MRNSFGAKSFCVASVTVAVAVAVGTTARCKPEDDPKDPNGSAKLVAHLLARSTQIFSGRIVYGRRFPAAGNAKAEVIRSDLVFSGPSWIETALPPTGAGARLSHQDKSISYTFTQQPDGSIRHVAQIELPKPMDTAVQEKVISGSYMEVHVRKFLDTHKAQGQRKKDKDVAGVPCQVWEWAVPKADVASAFESFTDLTKDGGLLRLYCAPQLGYV